MSHTKLDSWSQAPTIKRMVGFYHKDCTDGYFSGMLLKRVFERVGKPFELIGVSYQDVLLPFVQPGDYVVFADMSAHPEVIQELADTVVGITLYDHHESAVRKFDGLSEDFFTKGNVELVFDLTRCGAKLVYDELAFAALRIGDMRHYSRLIDRVNVWDLQLPQAQYSEYRAFAAYAKAKLNSLNEVDDFMNLYLIDGFASDQQVMQHGLTLVGVEDNHVQWAIENTLRVITLEVPDGQVFENVALVNAPKYLCTQIGRVLEDDYPIVMIYHDTPDGRVFRFSSKRGGIVVNTIAEQFGGGGHPHASGIQVLRDSYLGKL